MVSFIPIRTKISFYRSYLKLIPTKNHGKKKNKYTSVHSINKVSYSQNNLDLPPNKYHGVQCKKNINRSISAWDFILSFPQHSQHVNSTSIHQHHIKCPRYIPATHWTNVNKQKLQKSISSPKTPNDFCFVFFVLNMCFCCWGFFHHGVSDFFFHVWMICLFRVWHPNKNNGNYK